MLKPSPPQSEIELLARAKALAGCTFGELALAMGLTIGTDSVHAKGALGQLVEYALGASSGSLAQPDFNNLGIELKTIPLSNNGSPKESTYICTAPIPNPERDWHTSRVYRKMAHILWFPYLDASPISDRRLCTPLLWRMTAEIEIILKRDWEELSEMIHLGNFEKLSAHLGTYLQVRPKAANSDSFIQVLNHQGETISLVPRGFYIRSHLTKMILENYS